MGRVVVMEPHNDDAVLFSCFNICRHVASGDDVLIATMLDSRIQAEACGITAATRRQESSLAAEVLGAEWVQVPIPDDDPAAWAADGYRWIEALGARCDHVYAPMPEPAGGHPDHDAVGHAAMQTWGDRVTWYTTYRPGGPRTQGRPVPYDREWLLLKLKAMICFRSQILRGPYRFWTMSLEEYVADE